jgi:hypothetical protein
LKQTVFEENEALAGSLYGTSGGAVALYAVAPNISDIEISQCTFIGNRGKSAGAVHAKRSATIQLLSTLFERQSALGGIGAAVAYLDDSFLRVDNTTIIPQYV